MKIWAQRVWDGVRICIFQPALECSSRLHILQRPSVELRDHEHKTQRDFHLSLVKLQPREEGSCVQMPRPHVPSPSQGDSTLGGSSWRGAPPTKPLRSALLLCPVRGTLGAPALQLLPLHYSQPSGQLPAPSQGVHGRAEPRTQVFSPGGQAGSTGSFEHFSSSSWCEAQSHGSGRGQALPLGSLVV